MSQRIAELLRHFESGGTLTRKEQQELIDEVNNRPACELFAKAAADFMDHRECVPDIRDDDALDAHVKKHDELEEQALAALDEWRK